MDLKSIEELTSIINLCLKKGVKTVKISGDAIELTFTERQPQRRRARGEPTDPKVDNPYDEDAALFWSAGGVS